MGFMKRCRFAGHPNPDEVLNHGDLFDLLLGIKPQQPGCPNIDNFHACSIRGTLDVGRLRWAINALQERHPRMRARFYENPWTGYNYLLKSDEQIPLDVRSSSYATINTDLEQELRKPIDSLKGPFCRIAYVQHQAEGTGLLIYHQNHGVGDGRSCEIVLSQLLKLYDGQDVPHFGNTKSLHQLYKITKAKLAQWHRIEWQMPKNGPNTVAETFVDPKHPAFEANFDGVCIEIVRLDATATKRLLEACRRHRSTVTSAVGAAIVYAVMAELLDRKRKTEFVTIGMTINYRGRTLGPEFDEACGNLVADMHINCEPKPSFWETAAQVAKLYTEVIDADCAFEAFLAGAPSFTCRESMRLMHKATPAHIAAFTGGLEHTNMASFGVLKRFGKYANFEVLENFALSHALFLGCKVNLCTSGSSGRFTACVMVTRNVVPNARHLACKLRDHIETILTGVLADEGSPNNDRILQWCGEVATSMDEAVQARRRELALAPKSNSGVIFRGDTRGNSSSTTHLRLGLNLAFALVAGGGLSGFPIYKSELGEAGVFNYLCPPGQNTCQEQHAALSRMYQLATFATFGLAVLTGYAFDILGARRTAVLGATISSVCMFIIGCAICLDARKFPTLQVVVLYTAYAVGDAGDLLSTFGILGWMWHYPLRQMFIVGLQNGAYQGSSVFGILFVWMVDAGFGLHLGFFAIGCSNLVAALGFHMCTPSRTEYFREAGKVLNTNVSSLDLSVFAGLTHLLSQLKAIWGVAQLFLLENCLFFLTFPLYAAMQYEWLGNLEDVYKAWFGATGRRELVNVFTSAYSIIGIVGNPIGGLILGCIGFRPYYFGCTLLVVVTLISEPVRSIAAQKICITALSACMATMQNLQQKWCVTYGPPELFGTWTGLMVSGMGLGAVVIHGLVDVPLTVILATALLLQVGCLLVLAVRGMPKHPPRNQFDSADFLLHCSA